MTTLITGDAGKTGSSGRDEAQRSEQALNASGADWTIIRSAFFVRNVTESLWAAELAATTRGRHG